jgi:hypothetical protein|tara:strand:+ start:666 stop:884 length:219 start_codon:yes stop_codon:yes gene_type:complete
MADSGNLQELEQMYLDLIQPDKLIQHFPTDMEFVEWLGLGTHDELQWCLKAFERAELFSHCILIKRQIDLRE